MNNESWPAKALSDDSTNRTIFNFIIAPLPAMLLAYLISAFLYRQVMDSLGGPIYSWEELKEIMDEVTKGGPNDADMVSKMYWVNQRILWNKAGNIFLRVFPFVAYGGVVAAILMIPSQKRRLFTGADAFSCGIRANCVALSVVLVMTALWFINPFGEKVNEQTFVEGIAISWSQIFGGLGSFLLFQLVALKTKVAETKGKEGVERGLEKKKSEGEIFIPNPHQSTHEMLVNESRKQMEMQDSPFSAARKEYEETIKNELRSQALEQAAVAVERGELRPEDAAKRAKETVDTVAKMMGEAFEEKLKEELSKRAAMGIQEGIEHALREMKK